MLSWIGRRKTLVLGFGLLIIFTVVIFFPKLSLENRLLITAKKELENKQYIEAVADFERVMKYAPRSEAGFEAARLGGDAALYYAKNYKKAIEFYRHIVREGQSRTEAQWAQQKIAEVYYEKLADYPQAIIEYERLLSANPSKDEANDYKLRVARCYFYDANFDQSVSEADQFVANQPQDKRVYDMLMIKGNALLAQKKHDDALATYKKAYMVDPQNKEVYQVFLNISLVYEEKEEWEKAIEALQEIRDRYPHPDVIDLKIKSIQRRKERKKE